MEDTNSELACRHVDEHCGHGCAFGHGLCVFKESPGHFVAHGCRGFCHSIWPWGVRAQGFLGAAVVGLHDRRGESTPFIRRCGHRVFVWRFGGGGHWLHVCAEGAADHHLLCLLDRGALSHWDHEVDHPDHWRCASEGVGHLARGVHECHSQHFCGPNRGAPRGEAFHRDHDAIGVVCGDGRWLGVCGRLGVGGLRPDWGSC